MSARGRRPRPDEIAAPPPRAPFTPESTLIAGAEAERLSRQIEARRARPPEREKPPPASASGRAYRPKPLEPGTASDVFRELRIVNGIPLLPRESISRLFNIPPPHVRDRLRSIGINPGEARFLTCKQVKALSQSLRDNPDEARWSLDGGSFSRKSRPIGDAGIGNGWKAFCVAHHIEQRRPPTRKETAWDAAERLFFNKSEG